MNSLIDKYNSIKNNPWLLIAYVANRLYWLFPNKLFLSIQFRARLKNWIDWNEPKTYNEKLQWLKLYYKRPEYTDLVDKYAVKQKIAELIGEEYIIPTIAVYDNFEDIDFDAFPNQFVLKCTHDSGGLVICKDKNSFDVDFARTKINKSLKNNFYSKSKEWPYKSVPPRIIVEQYMEDESGYELKDYKFFCFDGVPKALFVAADRGIENEETKFNFYDMNFNLLPFTNGHPNSEKPIAKPKSFELMKELAAKLSEGMPHVRIDFYDIYGKVYFGEITFFHWSGLVPFEPEEWDYKFGEWIKLPKRIEYDK